MLLLAMGCVREVQHAPDQQDRKLGVNAGGPGRTAQPAVAARPCAQDAARLPQQHQPQLRVHRVHQRRECKSVSRRRVVLQAALCAGPMPVGAPCACPAAAVVLVGYGRQCYGRQADQCWPPVTCRPLCADVRPRLPGERGGPSQGSPGACAAKRRWARQGHCASPQRQPCRHSKGALHGRANVRACACRCLKTPCLTFLAWTARACWTRNTSRCGLWPGSSHETCQGHHVDGR